jgi:hypothetical protein
MKDDEEEEQNYEDPSPPTREVKQVDPSTIVWSLNLRVFPIECPLQLSTAC